ncbi:MAG: chromosome condensation regulator RCC1, partial [Dehalococcoidia bacterium]
MRDAFAIAALVAVSATLGLVSTGHASGIDVVAVEAGGRHTCIIVDEGDVMCWGQNVAGQLGDGTTDGSSAPVQVPGLSGVQAISAAELHTCALMSDGRVLCWGEHDGRLGVPAPDGAPSPTPEFVCADESCVSSLSGVLAVSAGGAHTCALMDGGAVKCWGENEDGQLGDGTMTDRTTPVEVAGLPGAVAVAAGGSHTCAITAGGAAFCWGSNGEGQIGDGRACGFRCSSPSPVTGLENSAAAITSAGLHSCALTAAGAVRCWGLNFDGQAGDGTEDNIRIESTAVSGLSSGVVAISADGRFRGHTCALRAAGDVRCWGDNDDGQLGDGTTTDRLVPVTVPGLADIAALAAGKKAEDIVVL